MSEENENIVNIWYMVGMILSLYGVIITGCGVYYAMTEIPATVMGETNPSLWWGTIMLVSGLLLVFTGKKSKA